MRETSFSWAEASGIATSFWQDTAVADAARAKGKKVYGLNIGQPDIKTPQCGIDAVKSLDRDILEYSPSEGYLSLRTKMVSY